MQVAWFSGRAPVSDERIKERRRQRNVRAGRNGFEGYTFRKAHLSLDAYSNCTGFLGCCSGSWATSLVLDDVHTPVKSSARVDEQMG